MTAQTLDLVLEQGATFDFDFTWMDTSVATDGSTVNTPKNLTGCTARMQIRAGFTRPVILAASSANGRITLGGANGKVHVVVPAAITMDAPVYKSPTGARRVYRRARYDLEVEWPDGRVDRVLQGKVTISPNITYDEPTP